MEPSRRNLSAAVMMVFLLAMAADVARVQAEQLCYYKSGTFHGACMWPDTCPTACRKEASPHRPGHNYSGGKCRHPPEGTCYCSEPCVKKPSGARKLAGGQGGDGARAQD